MVTLMIPTVPLSQVMAVSAYLMATLLNSAEPASLTQMPFHIPR